MRTPEVVPSPPLRGAAPHTVRIYEVGPRDGLQNESVAVPTTVKAELVRRLAAAGLPVIETTSFVPARWVPQLGDAEELIAALGDAGRGRNRPVLVPNLRGLERAMVSGVSAVAVFASATESFAQANLNASMADSLARFEPVVAQAKAAGMWARGYVSMCFGDPWEGPVGQGAVSDVVLALREMGCDEVSLGDTIGVATPGQVRSLLARLEQDGMPRSALAVHFHDTYGQALANSLAAVEDGIGVVDASAGGLGGCPFARSATGNLATEDLVWALHGMGIETGVDLAALVETSLWLAERLGRPAPSRVVRALAT